MLSTSLRRSNNGVLTEWEVPAVLSCVPGTKCGLNLLVFGGKGGVGKTTCAAAMAVYLANKYPDHTYLIVSTDPAHSLNDSFAGSNLPSNLKMLEIDARECLRRFKDAHNQHLQKIAMYGTFLDEDDIEQLLELSMPGLDEVMAFNEISALVETNAYSCVIVDTAPTGYTLRFLGLPDVLCKWIEALDAMLAKHRYMVTLHHGCYRKQDTDLFIEKLAESIKRLESLLSDPHRCCFVPVMLAESSAINETSRLVHALEGAKIPIESILINRIYPAEGCCPVCQSVREKQEIEVDNIRDRFPGYILWSIPLQGPEVRGVDQLADFWNGAGMIEHATLRASMTETEITGPNGAGHELPTDTTIKLETQVESPASLPSAQMRLILFAGKGGVGKTTLATATALRMAREYRGREVFLFSTDPAHSLSDCLGIPVGSREVRVCDGLTAMEINAEAEFEKLKQQYADEVEIFFGSITSRTMMDMTFDHDVIERIMDLSPPGLDEVMALTRALQLLEAGKYNVFIFDTAPTGHLIRLLELPAIIQEWLKSFFGLFLKYKSVFRLPKITDRMVAMSKRIKCWRSLLMDSREGGIYAVTIPTEMALEETRDLFAACRQMGINVPAMFVNLATPLDGCSLCNALARKESIVCKEYCKAFKGVPQTIVYRHGQPWGLNRLIELGEALYGH